MNKYLKIAPTDNVCVAIEDLVTGDVLNIDGANITIKDPITTSAECSR